MTIRRWLWALGASLLLFMGVSPGQELIPEEVRPIKKNLCPSELAALLAEPVAVDDFQNPMTLKEFFAELTAYYRNIKGREVLFHVNHNAFKDENPDTPDVLEVHMQFPAVPRLRTGVQLLRFVLGRVPSNNAAFLPRPGYVEITTQACTTAGALLSERILVRFQGRPLHLALEDLYEKTGVPLVLDGRVGILARVQVNLHIGKETPLGTVLVLMTEMANLKVVVIDDVVIVTTPALAQQMLWEKLLRSYLLPDWTNELSPFRHGREENAV